MRAKVFEQFYEFNERLIINLKYGKERVSKIADDYEYVKRSLAGESLLSEEDDKFLQSYLSPVGKSDAISQIDYLTERKEALSEYKKSSQENYKKYGSLYVKLGLMAGILVAVLLA